MRADHAARNTDDEPPSPHVRRILVVDDEVSILFAYTKLMQLEGIQVDTCETLQQALDRIASTVYFAVITDIRLSGSETHAGLQLVEAVRLMHPETKVIVITGYGSNEVRSAVSDLGVSHFFEKPVDPTLIMNVVKHQHISQA